MHEFADYARAALVLGMIAALGIAIYLRDTTGVFLLVAGMLLAWGGFRALNRISGGALLGDETVEDFPDEASFETETSEERSKDGR